jgi:hypothetical protein
MQMETELHFWLAMLSDHLVFLEQTQFARTDREQTQLRDKIDKLLAGKHTVKDVLQVAKEAKVIKVQCMVRALTGQSTLNPIFINHMIDVTDECISSLSAYLETGQCVDEQAPLYLHKLWISSAKIYTAQLSDQLDLTEARIRSELKKLHKSFSRLYDKTLDYISFMRSSGPSGFPAITTLTKEAKATACLFLELLVDIYDKRKAALILGNLTLLMVEHVIAAMEYYIDKL